MSQSFCFVAAFPGNCCRQRIAYSGLQTIVRITQAIKFPHNPRTTHDNCVADVVERPENHHDTIENIRYAYFGVFTKTAGAVAGRVPDFLTLPECRENMA